MALHLQHLFALLNVDEGDGSPGIARCLDPDRDIPAGEVEAEVLFLRRNETREVTRSKGQTFKAA